MSGPRLDALEVLALDCQATGATPRHGHVIEIAWARAAASPPQPEPSHFLVALPEGERIPRMVSQVTGLTTDQLQGAPPPAGVWRALLDAIPTAPASASAAPFPA